MAALVASHPDPLLLRQRAEALLMQAQVGLALTEIVPLPDAQSLRLPPGQMKTALDYLFRPVLHLDAE